MARSMHPAQGMASENITPPRGFRPVRDELRSFFSRFAARPWSSAMSTFLEDVVQPRLVRALSKLLMPCNHKSSNGVGAAMSIAVLALVIIKPAMFRLRLREKLYASSTLNVVSHC